MEADTAARADLALVAQHEFRDLGQPEIWIDDPLVWYRTRVRLKGVGIDPEAPGEDAYGTQSTDMADEVGPIVVEPRPEADHRAAIALRIESETKAWLEGVFVDEVVVVNACTQVERPTVVLEPIVLDEHVERVDRDGEVARGEVEAAAGGKHTEVVGEAVTQRGKRLLHASLLEVVPPRTGPQGVIAADPVETPVDFEALDFVVVVGRIGAIGVA